MRYAIYLKCFYPSVDGHLVCSHVWAVVSTAAVNMGVQTSLGHSDFVFFAYLPRSGIVESYGSPIFTFLGSRIYR